MRSIASLCAAGVLAAAGIGSAMAADLPARPLPQGAPIAAPGYVPDWAGFYFGFHGGGGWADASFHSTVAAAAPTFATIPDASASGGVFGGHFGYNWQYGPVVAGIEADASAADLKDTTVLAVGPGGVLSPFDKEFKVDTLASVRGRLGYSWLPNLLIYGTGGLGYAHTKLSAISTTPVFVGDEADSSRFGWVAGAGLEYRWLQHILLRVEYLHYDFGRESVTLNGSPVGGPPLPGLPVNYDTQVDVVRGGISYKF